MKKIHSNLQMGQAAVEFVFALLFVIALASVLFQALHFELDVFNKMGILRFKAMQRMHYDNRQYDNSFGDDNQTVTFKRLSELTSYRVIFQTADQNMRYPEKRLSYKRGTQVALPQAFTTGVLVGVVACITGLDRFEDTAGNCVVPFRAINSALNNVQ